MNALEICEHNAAAAAQSRAERRAKFPFTVGIVDELVAAGLQPRVMWMREGEHEWCRGNPAERAT